MGPSIHAVSSVSCFSNGPRRIVRARLYTTLGGGLLPVGESKKRGCGHFLGDRTQGFGCVHSRGTQAGGGTLSHDINDDRRSGRTSRSSDQTAPGTPAGEGSPLRRPYGETHHPLETGRKTIEPVSGGMRGSKPTGGSARA